MTPANDPEAYLNTFERMATAAGWERATWAAVLIPCLISPAQQVMETVALADLNDYDKACAAILNMFNLSPKVYRRRLRETYFGPDYQPRATG